MTTQSSKLMVILSELHCGNLAPVNPDCPRCLKAKAAILELMRAEINDIDAWGHDFLCNVGDHNIHTELVAKGCNCGTGRICKKLIDNLEKL